MMSNELSATEFWDRVCPDFVPAEIFDITVGSGVTFKVLYVPREGSATLPVYYHDTRLTTFAAPRPAAIRHRFVLNPGDVLAGEHRWTIRVSDVRDWMQWARTTAQFVTWSSFKSGGSWPFDVHSQSFPMALPDGSPLPALPYAPTQVKIPGGDLPRYRAVEVAVLADDYPVRGIRLRAGEGATGADAQVANLAWELCLNWDHLKSFNIAVVPRDEGVPDLFCFPRRRDGRTTYGNEKHQVAALELAGLIQAKKEERKNEFISNPALVGEMISHTTPGKEEFHDFLTALEA